MIEDKPSLEEVMEHVGVKGMHWGIRNTEASSKTTPSAKEPMTSEHKKAIAKKVAIGTGVLLVVAGTAAVVYTLNKNGNLPLNNLSKHAVDAGKKATDSVLKEPTSIIHTSRGKNFGFRFLKDGGIPLHVLSEFDTAFPNSESGSQGFRRYGAKGSEKIAASFLDPEGRKDFSGRIIPHQVIVPSVMTSGINNLDDVKAKIWPLISADYAAGWDKVHASTYQR